jgi:hypothetical protein
MFRPAALYHALFAGMMLPPPVTIAETLVDITPRSVPRMSQAKRRRLMRQSGTTSAGKSRNRPRNTGNSRPYDRVVEGEKNRQRHAWNVMSKAGRKMLVRQAADRIHAERNLAEATAVCEALGQ